MLISRRQLARAQRLLERLAHAARAVDVADRVGRADHVEVDVARDAGGARGR